MEEEPEQSFFLAIASRLDEAGKTSYHVAEFNKGVPLEQVITITRMWLKKAEKA